MENFIIINVKIIPNSSVNKIVGFENENILKIRIKAPPEKGKANKVLIKFLSKTLAIPPYYIEIISGHTSKLKKLKIFGITKNLLTQIADNE
ncbi:MAG: YggU family protein [Parachlamydiales bacterium]|nr:YggU family protein [Parachlamydiales bacterium]